MYSLGMNFMHAVNAHIRSNTPCINTRRCVDTFVIVLYSYKKASLVESQAIINSNLISSCNVIDDDTSCTSIAANDRHWITLEFQFVQFEMG